MLTKITENFYVNLSEIQVFYFDEKTRLKLKGCEDLLEIPNEYAQPLQEKINTMHESDELIRRANCSPQTFDRYEAPKFIK